MCLHYAVSNFHVDCITMHSVDLCVLYTYSWAFGVVLWEIMTYGMCSSAL